MLEDEVAADEAALAEHVQDAMVCVPVRYHDVEHTLQDVVDALALVADIEKNLADVEELLLRTIEQLPEHILIGILQKINSLFGELDELLPLDIKRILDDLILESYLYVREHCDELYEFFFWYRADTAVRHRFYRVQRVAIEQHVDHADQGAFLQVSEAETLAGVEVLIHFACTVAGYE